MPAEAAANLITCPQCGGQSELPSGRRLVRCEFCDGTLFVDRAGAVNHYRLPALLSAGEARAALKRWMAGNDTVKDLDRKATVESVEPVAFPMWMFRLRRRGGEEVVVEPAAPTPIPQLADLQVPAGRLEPFTPAGEGVEAMTATVPLETARGWLAQRGGGKGGEGSVSESAVTESAMVEVPLWRCSYSFGGRQYQALVEGSTGTVLAAVYPEKAEAPYVLVTVAGVLLFTLEGLLISNPAAKLVVFAITALPLALVAYWVARRV